MLCVLGTTKPNLMVLHIRNESGPAHVTYLGELGLDGDTLPALRKAQALRVDSHVPRDAVVHSVVIDSYEAGRVSMLAALRSGQVLQLVAKLASPVTFELVRGRCECQHRHVCAQHDGYALPTGASLVPEHCANHHCAASARASVCCQPANVHAACRQGAAAQAHAGGHVQCASTPGDKGGQHVVANPLDRHHRVRAL